jgi:hypothetical protein
MDWQSNSSPRTQSAIGEKTIGLYKNPCRAGYAKAKINSFKTVTFTQTKTTNSYTNKVKSRKQNKVVSLA